MRYDVQATPTFEEMIAGISDPRLRGLILDRAEKLSTEPESQGKPLGGELRGLRSVRAAQGRYRIIYQVERSEVTVLLLAAGLRRAGHRKDIYALTERLARFGLI